MNADKLFNLAGFIVFVGLVTTLVAHKNTARTIGAIGGAFQGSLRTAMGR